MKSKRTIFLILVDTELESPTTTTKSLQGLYRHMLETLVEADIPVLRIDFALLETGTEPEQLGESTAMDIFYFFYSPFHIICDDPEDEDEEEGDSSFIDDLIQKSALLNGADLLGEESDIFPEGKYAYAKVFGDEEVYRATLKALQEYELTGNDIKVISFPSSLVCFARHFLAHLMSGSLPDKGKKVRGVEIKPDFRKLLEDELKNPKKKN